ncbi:hypothetical protein HDU99_000842 [Rhizoclosmatium hyalinum]|nr:hypothetical protein HDU99_000842 [Rhizoclosmatium hyalinum]
MDANYLATSIAAFIAQTGADPDTAQRFLFATDFDLSSATVLFAQNWQFKSDVVNFYAANPPYPFDILEHPLFEFIPDIARDVSGVPILIVNLRYWRTEWDLNSMNSNTVHDPLRDLQWALYWILSKALELPSVQQHGLTLLSNTDDANPSVSVDSMHVILLEFIRNVIPIKLVSLIICDSAPKSFLSRAWSIVSPQSKFLESFGVKTIQCTRQSLHTYIDPSNIPIDMGGKLYFRHEDWYQNHLPTFSKLDYTRPVLPKTAHHPSVTLNAAQRTSEAEPSLVTELFTDAVVAVSTLSRTSTTSATLPSILSKVSPEVAATYLSLVNEYKETQTSYLSSVGRPMDESQVSSLRTKTLNQAKTEFGTELHGLDLLDSIKDDLSRFDKDFAKSYSESLYYSLMNQVLDAKKRWEARISSRTMTTEGELNDQCTDLLAEIKPETAPKGVWESVVSAVDELVRKPLIPFIAEESEKDKVKGKGKV